MANIVANLNGGKELSLGRAAPFYEELQDQGTYLPAYAPQPQLGYSYGDQLGYSGASEYAMVLTLFLMICFLFMAVGCFTSICCGASGYVFGRRSVTQGERKGRRHDFEVM